MSEIDGLMGDLRWVVAHAASGPAVRASSGQGAAQAASRARPDPRTHYDGNERRAASDDDRVLATLAHAAASVAVHPRAASVSMALRHNRR
jgi:hypothetical protein